MALGLRQLLRGRHIYFNASRICSETWKLKMKVSSCPPPVGEAGLSSPPTGSTPVSSRSPVPYGMGLRFFFPERTALNKIMSNIKVSILSTYGVLHSADGLVLRRGITATEETRPEGVFIVIDGKSFSISEVRRLEHPTRLVLPDGSYVMP